MTDQINNTLKQIRDEIPKITREISDLDWTLLKVKGSLSFLTFWAAVHTIVYVIDTIIRWNS